MSFSPLLSMSSHGATEIIPTNKRPLESECGGSDVLIATFIPAPTATNPRPEESQRPYERTSQKGNIHQFEELPSDAYELAQLIDLVNSSTISARDSDTWITKVPFERPMSYVIGVGDTDRWWQNLQVESQVAYDEMVQATRFFSSDSLLNLFDKVESGYKRDLAEPCWHGGPVDLRDVDRIPLVYYQKVSFNEHGVRIVCLGDIHSSLKSLTETIGKLKTLDPPFFVENTMKIAPKCALVFLGDLVDRGPYSIEVLALVFAIKTIDDENWSRVLVVSGNHESCSIYKSQGLGAELIREYPDTYPQFMHLQNGKCKAVKLRFLHLLPAAIVLATCDSKYFLCHGSIDADSLTIDQMREGGTTEDRLSEYRYRTNDGSSYSDTFLAYLKNSNAVYYSPPSTTNAKFNHQLRWNDMEQGPGISPNPGRGSHWLGDGSVMVGGALLKVFCKDFGFRCILSGHQGAVLTSTRSLLCI